MDELAYRASSVTRVLPLPNNRSNLPYSYLKHCSLKAKSPFSSSIWSRRP